MILNNLSKPVIEVKGWYQILLDTDPQVFSIKSLSGLFQLADAMIEVPMFHAKTIRVIVKFANTGKLRTESREWILSRLYSENYEVVFRTLQGIHDLQEIDETILVRVLDLLENRNGQLIHVESAAFDTIVAWKPLDDRTYEILRMITRGNFLSVNPLKAQELIVDIEAKRKNNSKLHE